MPQVVRRVRAPLRALVCCLSVLLLAPLGCGSHDTKEDKPAAGPSDEVKSLQGQVTELSRQKKAADDQLTDTSRELDRTRRELEASRETANKSGAEARLSQEVLALQKKSYDTKIADLLARLATAGPSAAAGQGAGTSDALAGGPGPAPAPTPSATPAAPGAPTSSPARFKPIDLDVAVATVDGEPVSRREFVEALYYNYATEYLDTYVKFVLVHREAQRLGIVVSEADAERDVAESWGALIQRAKSEDKLNEQLAVAGISKSALLSVLRANARTTATIRRVIVAERETPDGKLRFEQKLHEWYDKNFGEKVLARHILIPVKAGTSEEGWKDVEQVAVDLKAQLTAGTEWAEVAKQARLKLKVQVQVVNQEYARTAFSTDCSELERAPIVRALFDSKPDEIVAPVRWKAGVSIVLVEKKIPPATTFEEKRADLERDVREKQNTITQEDSDDLFKALSARAKIEKHLELDR